VLCLQDIGSRQHVFSVTLKHFGCFPHARRPRVLWIGLEKGAEHLMRVARDIDESLQQCGFPRDSRFHLHLTIGRAKRQCTITDILKHEFLSEEFKVNTLVLFKSTLTPQGAIYEVLETFPFGKNSKNQ
jgi:2'-5' RNA ligase